MNYWEENVAIFQELDPQGAEELLAVDVSQFELSESRSGELNLCDSSGDRKRYLHSNYCPVKEAEQWLQEIDLESIKVLYVFGVGLGYAYDVLKAWLKEDAERYVVFIEDDLRVLKRFFESERGHKMMLDEQVTLIRTYIDREYLEVVLQDLALCYVGLPFEAVALPFYKRHREEVFTEFHRQLMHATAYVFFAGQEFMEYGVAFFRNFYSNMLRLAETTGAKSMFGAFKDVPAIICGAGPSLDPQIDFLKELDDKALIFAGGSAINALTKKGMMPHFGASIDPNPTQAERMREHQGYELPIFFKGRTHRKAFEALHGPKVYLCGNNMYPVTDWIEEKLGIEEPTLTEGYNVLHLLIDMATKFGCNPIVFVGMDLAFTDMKSYSGDVVGDATVSKEAITKGTDLNNNAFVREDINKKPVYTLWKWVAESQYTSHYAARHEQTLYLNATEGGLGFEGIQNVSLKEAAKEHFTLPYDLRNWVHQELQESRFEKATKERVEACFQELDDSLESCYQLTKELAKEFESLEEAFKRGRGGEIRKCSEKVESLHEKLSDEIACKQILEPVNKVRSIIYERKFSQINYNKEVRSDLERMLERCEQNRREVLSLKESTELNQALLRDALGTRQEEGRVQV